MKSSKIGIIISLLTLFLSGCTFDGIENEYGFNLPSTSIAWSIDEVLSDSYSVNVSATIDDSSIYGSDLIGVGFLVESGYINIETDNVVTLQTYKGTDVSYCKFPCEMYDDNMISSLINNLHFDKSVPIQCYIETGYGDIISVGSLYVYKSKTSFVPVISDCSIEVIGDDELLATINYSVSTNLTPATNITLTFADEEYEVAVPVLNDKAEYQVQQSIKLSDFNDSSYYEDNSYVTQAYISVINTCGEATYDIDIPEEFKPVLESDVSEWSVDIISANKYKYTIPYNDISNTTTKRFYLAALLNKTYEEIECDINFLSEAIEFVVDFTTLSGGTYGNLSLCAQNLFGYGLVSDTDWSVYVSDIDTSVDFESDGVYDDYICVAGVSWAKGNLWKGSGDSYYIAPYQWSTFADGSGDSSISEYHNLSTVRTVTTSATSNASSYYSKVTYDVQGDDTYDLATKYLGDDWALPNESDFEKLNYTSFQAGVVNGISGILFFTPENKVVQMLNQVSFDEDYINNSKGLFLPLCGELYDGSVSDAFTAGYYLSSTMFWHDVDYENYYWNGSWNYRLYHYYVLRTYIFGAWDLGKTTETSLSYSYSIRAIKQ